jgi:serine/threonine protein kinase
MKNLVGTTLGRYEILEKIGQGGMASVFKAYQPGLDRFVAIKVLSPTLAEEAGFTERFQREAQSVARLHHPNILQVYDFGTQDNYNYLVMRYVEASTSLGDLIQTGVPPEKLIDYIVQVADALNYAHEQGIIHRDVKPGNILIDGKWALLSDFGLVKIKQAATQLTSTGIGMGTPAYMSPEQAAGTEVDNRTDIYALGIILHRILTGAIPHDAPTPLAIMVKRQTEPVTSPRLIKPDLPESLEHVILRSLAPKPDQRYDTAVDFAEALKKAESDPTYREVSLQTLPAQNDATIYSAAHQTVFPPRKTAPSSSRKIGLLAGGIVAVVAVIGILVLLWMFLLPDQGTLAAQSTPATPTLASTTEPVVSPPTATSTSVPATATPTPILPGAPSAITKTEMEVRSGPGDEYDLLGYLPEGATAEITSQDKSRQWWQIKTSLSASGIGWIKADSDFVTATDTESVPIALAPPTPTGTATPVPDTPTPTGTATPTPVISSNVDTATPTATATTPATPTPAATATAASKPAAVPTATKAPPAPVGQITLLKPLSLDQPSFGMTEFEWQWGAPLEPGQGFEVRVWREGEPPAGAHDAVLDNKNGLIQSLGNNTYRLNVNIKDAFGVKSRSGEYLWTVVLVQISPEYKDLGIQAPPAHLRFEAGGKGGGGGGGGDGGTSF